MLDLGTLQAHIKLDGADKFKSDLDSSASKSDGFGSKLKGTFSKIGVAAAAGFAAVGAAAVAGAKQLADMVDETAKLGDEIDKGSQKANMSAEAYQRWSLVAEHGGTSVQTMSKAMKGMIGNIESNADAFAKLGVATHDADGNLRASEDTYKDTMIAIAGLGTEQERYAAAVDMYGAKVAKELMPTLNQGAEALAEQYDYLNENNGLMSDDAVKAAAAYEDAMTDMNASIKGLTTSIGSALMPIATELIQAFTNDVLPAIRNVANFIGQKLQPIFQKIADVIQNRIIPIFRRFFQSAEGEGYSGGVFDAISGAIDFITGVIMTAIDWVVNLWESFANNEMVHEAIKAIVELLETLWATVQDVWGMISGVIDDIKPYIQPVIDFIITLFMSVITTLAKVVTGFLKFSQGVRDALKNLPQIVGNIIDNVCRFFTQTIPNAINQAVEWFRSLPGRILSALGDLRNLLVNAGRNIIQGFLDGLKGAFDDVKNFVGGIGDWIAAHKGPKAYDLKLLVPAGGWIMEGLQEGLENSMPELRKVLDNISSTISNTNFSATANLATVGGGTMQAMNATNAVQAMGNNYNVYINGTRINDDAQIEGKFVELMSLMARKGMM